MRVLIACEFSGIVRDAFIARGHDAVSCDLLPTERPGPHIQDDVLKHLDDGWDMMIAHPPCTYLSYAAAGYWNRPGRAELREEAMRFFMALYNAPILRVCVENPRGYPMQAFRRHDQQIDPYMFGHVERKRTCLWLRGLPLLNPTSALWKRQDPIIDQSGKCRYATDMKSSSDWKGRSRTYQGVADAMASQWG